MVWHFSFFVFVFALQTISSDLSSKIIKEALKQQKEILEEENREDNFKASFSNVSAPRSVQEENDDEEEDIDAFDGFSDTLSQYEGGEVWSLFFNHA